MTQRRSENRELNKAGSKPDPFDQPVRTAHTIVHSLIAWNTVVQTERVTLIYPLLQTNITDQIWPSGGNGLPLFSLTLSSMFQHHTTVKLCDKRIY